MLYLASTIIIITVSMLLYIKRHDINVFIDQYPEEESILSLQNQVVKYKIKIEKLRLDLKSLKINFKSIYQKRYYDLLKITRVMIKKQWIIKSSNIV